MGRDTKGGTEKFAKKKKLERTGDPTYGLCSRVTDLTKRKRGAGYCLWQVCRRVVREDGCCFDGAEWSGKPSQVIRAKLIAGVDEVLRGDTG